MGDGWSSGAVSWPSPATFETVPASVATARAPTIRSLGKDLGDDC